MEEIFACVPTQPIPSPSPAEGSVSAVACSVVVSEDEADEDRISRLADALLSNIVSRLPIKDAARTAALSPRWRRVWASTPLVLDDAHLLPDPDQPDDGPLGFGTDWRSIANAVSSVLAAHPGPFRGVCLTNVCSYAAARDRVALVRDWLCVLADKGVDDFVLVCSRWPLKAKIPADILRVASLRSLYLGLRDEFPGSTKYLRGGNIVFPNLLELGLCRTDVKTGDIDHLLQCSPLLEKLALVACDNSPDCGPRAAPLLSPRLPLPFGAARSSHRPSRQRISHPRRTSPPSRRPLRTIAGSGGPSSLGALPSRDPIAHPCRTSSPFSSRSSGDQTFPAQSSSG